MRARLTCVGRQGAAIDLDLSACLTAVQREQVREEANRWIKRLRLVPFDGTPMRARFTYRGDSLWWFTELYLHKMRQLDIAVETLLALEAARGQHAPERMRISTVHPVVQTAALAFAAATGQAVEIEGTAAVGRRASWNGFLVGLTAQASRLRPAFGRRRPPAGRIAAFVHTAFWRAAASSDAPEQEHYIGAVLAAIAARAGGDALACVGVGPRRHFRARRWWDPIAGSGAGPRVIPIEHLAPRASLAGALDVWRRRHELARQVVSGPAVRDAGVWRGYDLWPILKHELEEAARVQWPWSTRAMDEAGAALDALAPPVALTYAEAGGWGRALMLEARRRAIPSAGLQHGFIYRHWLNYRHEADEMAPLGTDRGFPRPDVTLVFDGYAAAYLEAEGRFPQTALAITGSPRLDDLAARVQSLAPERQSRRHQLGVGNGEMLVVLAAKFSGIQDELPGVIAAMSALPSVRLVIKTHPAETAEGYRRLAGDMPNVRVVEAETDLGGLLAVADALITMNSTVAVDALVLGVPALVVGLPNNLSPFVEAGVMAGAERADIRASLEALLYDCDAREEWRRRASAFGAAHQMSADGRAAARAADAILALAGR